MSDKMWTLNTFSGFCLGESLLTELQGVTDIQIPETVPIKLVPNRRLPGSADPRDLSFCLGLGFFTVF